MSSGSSESLVAALFKCLFVGVGVALTGLVVCALALPILLSLREPGLLVLLVILPFAFYFTWRATGRYMAGELNCRRAAIALASRYFVVGAALGLFLKLLIGGWISDTAFFVCLGSAIGTIGGSFGGAFQGWIQSRNSLKNSNSASQ